jgi:hypothetical protein
MRDEYFVPMNELIVHTRTETGYELPVDIEVYVSALLASFIDKPNFLPERSFAEAYALLNKRDYVSAKQLGDTCLFLSGVFPKYGSRYGLNKTYYSAIGSSSYSILHQEIFRLLAKHFDFVAEYIHISTKPRRDIRISNES